MFNGASLSAVDSYSTGSDGVRGPSRSRPTFVCPIAMPNVLHGAVRLQVGAVPESR
jgi:hypothetical protein